MFLENPNLFNEWVLKFIADEKTAWRWTLNLDGLLGAGRSAEESGTAWRAKAAIRLG
jgi:hypothetical protein